VSGSWTFDACDLLILLEHPKMVNNPKMLAYSD
jgi:hypothetical protein